MARQFIHLVILALFTSAFAAAGAAPSGVGVSFRLENDWGAGANVTFILTNRTDEAIANWELAFDFPSKISPHSHATLAEHTGRHHVFKNLSYAILPANGSVSFQCAVSPGNVGAEQPVNYLFNGAALSGGPAVLQITTAELPAAGVGVAYSQTLAAASGTPPYAWSLATGALPGGLKMGGDGVIAGTASKTGTFSFTVQVADSAKPGATTNRALSITVATLPTLAIGDASLVLEPRAAGDGGNSFLSASGNQIVDARGQPVRITGVNWFGFETSIKAFHGLWTRGYKSGLDQIRELGFNTVRIPFSNEMLKSGATTSGLDSNKNPDLQGLTPLQTLDKVVAYCGQIGLRVILDRHSARADGYMNEDVWYIPGDAYYTEKRWIEDWVLLATHYAGNPTVIGADLFNEPKKSATWGSSAPATDWNKAAERCGNAILAANPNWLIIVEGTEKYAGTSTWWGGNLKGAAAHPVVLKVPNKLVYSMHDYPASVFQQTWFNSPDFPKNLGGVFDGYWGYLYKNNTAPLLLGEFGTKLATDKDRQWLDKLTDYIDGDFDLNGSNDLAPGKKGMSFTYWCFNPNSGDTGGLLNDDWTTVNQTRLAYLTNSLAPMLGRGTGTNSSPPAQTLAFTVTLSPAAIGPASVQWATTNGTATAGLDFFAAGGTLNFVAGESSKTIIVTIPPHPATETRQFTIQLNHPSGATLANVSGRGILRRP